MVGGGRLSLARDWWAQGAAVQVDTRGLALKKALASANRMGAERVLILGEAELEKGVVAVKRMASGEQEAWPWAEVPERLKD